MVNATEQAWRWIDRLGIPGPNPAEPLPPYVYVLAAHVAASPERRPARVRVRAGDGAWVVIRAAAFTTGLRSRQATPSPWRPPQPMTWHRCSCGPGGSPAENGRRRGW